MLFIWYQSFSASSPTVVPRSDTNILAASCIFSTAYAYSISYQWTVYKLDSTTYSVTGTLTYSYNNPTLNQKTLILPGNTLDYGLYQAVVQVQISVSGLGQTYAMNESTYLKVIPSGINVAGLENAVTSMTIGSRQGLTLKPATYSFDPDKVASISSLSFKFYCRIVNQSQTGVYYVNTTNGIVDLRTGLTENTCFNTSSEPFCSIY